MKKLFSYRYDSPTFLERWCAACGAATPKNAASNSKLKTEGNDMDAIIVSLPPENQEYIQELENDIRKAKADGDEEWPRN